MTQIYSAKIRFLIQKTKYFVRMAVTFFLNCQVFLDSCPLLQFTFLI